MARKWYCDKCGAEIKEAGAITVFIGVSYLFDEATREKMIESMKEKLYCNDCAPVIEKALGGKK